ncbi:CapA family protein [Streptomyces sp. S1A]|uniref:CapA family protein n=1 Tax=Streptomyces sp. ICN903 TaxID=2964654 RepID=UPI001EDC2414|nr:CapA family protein [Streptomyces sp. ICN903]MCG3039656.1 CapA family protein [Streptomyces sp. ICN903]
MIRRPGRLRAHHLPLLLALAASALTACGADGQDDGKPAAGGRSFSVAAAGDILIHTQLVDQAAKDAKATGEGVAGLDFNPVMAGIKPVISKADLAICHMEPVVGTPKGPFQSYPDFLVPPQITTAIREVGYDTCSTASNHTLDHGPAGVKRTLDALDEAGVKHTGSARSREEAEKPLIMDVKGVKVAQLSFAFGFNGREIPQDKPWITNRTSFKEIAAAERAARSAGADVVILSIHWGREHQPNPSTSQLKLGRRIAEETGIDLVIGHHAHVVQPMEKVNGTWIAYGLGNQLARHDVPTGLTEEGVIGWFEFTQRGEEWDVAARYVPTLVDIPPDAEEDSGAAAEGAEGEEQVSDHRLVDVAAALRNGDGLTDQQRSRYRLAFERTEGTMLNRGAAEDGLRPLRGLPG